MSWSTLQRHTTDVYQNSFFRFLWSLAWSGALEARTIVDCSCLLGLPKSFSTNTIVYGRRAGNWVVLIVGCFGVYVSTKATNCEADLYQPNNNITKTTPSAELGGPISARIKKTLIVKTKQVHWQWTRFDIHEFSMKAIVGCQ